MNSTDRPVTVQGCRAFIFWLLLLKLETYSNQQSVVVFKNPMLQVPRKAQFAKHSKSIKIDLKKSIGIGTIRQKHSKKPVSFRK